MERNCIIGLVQMESIAHDTERNLNKIITFAEEASCQGVDILCFPEMALHGYKPSEAAHLAEPLSGHFTDLISQCAVRTGVTLLVGMAEKHGENSKPFLSHIAAFADGGIGVYRKTHLGKSEMEFFHPGDEFPIFESHGVRFGIGLCWDWHFPEVSTIYSLKGAEVLFAPHASPRIIGDRREIWLRYLSARAYDNTVYLGACNLIGHNGYNQEFQGGALVLGPKGEIVNDNFEQGEGILTSLLSAEYINSLRSKDRKTMKEIFFLEHRRKELYREVIELDVQY